MSKQKLELTWIGKDQQPQLEPRILIEDREKSFGDRNSENMLIHGDNLLALKALEQDYANRIKCIYIDPPYNTGSAFEHYDDGVEHSIWLNLMYQRLAVLAKLLSSDGAIWVNLDDNEVHYCKVIMDEIFGRKNFVANIIWEKADSPRMDAKYVSSRHDHLLLYAKEIDSLKINRLIDDDGVPKHYNKKDEKGNIYYLKPLRAMGADGYREKRPTMYFPIIAPDGQEIFPKNPDGSDSRWRWGPERVEKDKDKLEWVNTKSGWSLYFRIFLEDSTGKPPETIWFNKDVGSNRTSKKEIKDLFQDDIFETPKPEKLIKRVIETTSSENDFILDSFLGSGTTVATAHKMGRKWIGIELGNHCETHCLPRLKKVVTGEDQGGISEALNWKGGGGFKYYYLAPSLLRKDKYDNWIIDKAYNAEMLAAAMSKHEGFQFKPDELIFWKQGQSTEKDFIFTTTAFVTVEYLDKIHEDMQEDESLLICCRAFQEPCETRHANITIKKIPQMLLGRCEFGKEDYSLNIINVPIEDEPEPIENENISEDYEKHKEIKPLKRKGKGSDNSTPELF